MLIPLAINRSAEKSPSQHSRVSKGHDGMGNETVGVYKCRKALHQSLHHNRCGIYRYLRHSTPGYLGTLVTQIKQHKQTNRYRLQDDHSSFVRRK